VIRTKRSISRHRTALLGVLTLGAALVTTQTGAHGAQAGGTRAQVACVLGRLTTQAKIGQLFMVGIGGTRSSASTMRLLRSWQAGGVILSGSNVGSAADLRTLTAGLQRTAALPLLIATDQEGGAVARIQVGLTPLPSEASYGRLGASRRVYADTQAQGQALKRLGINLNLAPVVDVLSNPDSPIGSRSFGPDPALDAQLAAAAIRGYQAAGIGATAKHFLGLGSVTTNADDALPVVMARRATLEARDLVPMRAAVAAGVDAVMVTRVLLPALDPRTPAYASAPIVQGVIRRELGFRGAVMTDSLLSRAVVSGPGPATAAVAALQAGDDILLLLSAGGGLAVSHTEQALNAVRQALAHGTVRRARLDDAVTHVLHLKARLGLLPRCGPVSTRRTGARTRVGHAAHKWQ
jgi:beta-N-acetylhexosaminidase